MGYLFWINDIIYSSFELLLMSKFECEVIIQINGPRWKALNFCETHKKSVPIKLWSHQHETVDIKHRNLLVENVVEKQIKCSKSFEYSRVIKSSLLRANWYIFCNKNGHFINYDVWLGSELSCFKCIIKL